MLQQHALRASHSNYALVDIIGSFILALRTAGVDEKKDCRGTRHFFFIIFYLSFYFTSLFVREVGSKSPNQTRPCKHHYLDVMQTEIPLGVNDIAHFILNFSLFAL